MDPSGMIEELQLAQKHLSFIPLTCTKLIWVFHTNYLTQNSLIPS